MDTFVAAVRERGSFLEERSSRYQFLHLSFQEFFAARHLAETVREVGEIAAFLEDGRLNEDWWREPALLLLGYLHNSSPEVAARLARRLARQPAAGALDPDWPPLDTAARLAGAALAAAGISEQPNAPPALHRELADLLTDLLTAGAGPKDWAETGDALGRLGDPRPGVGLRPDGLPDIVWCEVPAGPFLMGSDKDRDKLTWEHDLPLHTIRLPAYSVAKYPVTNAQYASFVAHGGYDERRFWTDVGWQRKDKRSGPETYGGSFDLPNHPVVGVSWYEAVAFCRWLTEWLHRGGGLKGNGEVRLPTEAEWEKAARGEEGQLYPWGEEPDPNRANYGDTGIGATSAVGCFPGGASPYGVEDVSGNVLEWCGTKWRNSYEDPADESLEGETPRVVRGGSFGSNQWYVRCAYRHWYGPSVRGRLYGFRVVLAPVPSDL